MKHTKGPWNVQAIGPDKKHLDEGGLFQLTGPEGESPMMDELKGNARLMSTAPEMLNLLKSVSCSCNPLYPCHENCFMIEIEKLIKKIEG